MPQTPGGEWIEPGGDTALLLFTSPGCAVCEVLRPKIDALLQNDFPRLPVRVIDCNHDPDQVHTLGVRTVPTVVVQIAGQEVVRLERVFSLRQLAEGIARPYRLYFDGPASN